MYVYIYIYITIVLYTYRASLRSRLFHVPSLLHDARATEGGQTFFLKVLVNWKGNLHTLNTTRFVCFIFVYDMCIYIYNNIYIYVLSMQLYDYIERERERATRKKIETSPTTINSKTIVINHVSSKNIVINHVSLFFGVTT